MNHYFQERNFPFQVNTELHQICFTQTTALIQSRLLASVKCDITVQCYFVQENTRVPYKTGIEIEIKLIELFVCLLTNGRTQRTECCPDICTGNLFKKFGEI